MIPVAFKNSSRTNLGWIFSIDGIQSRKIDYHSTQRNRRAGEGRLTRHNCQPDSVFDSELYGFHYMTDFSGPNQRERVPSKTGFIRQIIIETCFNDWD